MQFKITLASGASYTYEGTVNSLFKHITKNSNKGNVIQEVSIVSQESQDQ